MKTVMADGEIINIAGPALDPPGYDLRGLLVGSEGCLGIVTEIAVRITPKTESVITMLAIYDAIALNISLYRSKFPECPTPGICVIDAFQYIGHTPILGNHAPVPQQNRDSFIIDYFSLLPCL